MICDIGDSVDLTATFTDPETGEPVNPEKVVCTVLSPAGTSSKPTVSGSKGTYRATIKPTLNGKWRFAFDGTGEHQAAAEGVFDVRKPKVPRA